jgi:hypothetical protein
MNVAYTGDPLGLSFANEDCIMSVPVSTVVAVGDILAVDMTAVSSGFTHTTLAVPATAGFRSASDVNTTTFFCVALDAVASSSAIQKIRVRIRGKVLALVDGDSVDVTVGLKLQPVDGARTLVVAAGSGTSTLTRSVAVALEANAGTSALKWVLFDGITGFGYASSVS